MLVGGQRYFIMALHKEGYVNNISYPQQLPYRYPLKNRPKYGSIS
jgi:hypothetical protein